MIVGTATNSGVRKVAGITLGFRVIKIAATTLRETTRPPGATVGDLLDKPHASGGLEFSRFYASLSLAVFMIVAILACPQRAGAHSGTVAEKHG